MRHFALLAFFLLSAVSVLLPQAHADTLFHYISESGDYIGAGQEKTLTPAGGYTFSVSATSGHVGFEIDGASTTTDEFYSLDFAAPTGSNLAVGSYPGATRYPFQAATQPGLDFSGEGRGSNTLTGEFVVREITFDTSGNLLTFAADFVQHSEGAVPASYGEVRYNSSIPATTPKGVGQLATNAYSVIETAGSITVSATRREGSTGPLSINYATADGTDLAGRDYIATSGTLTWTDGDTADKTFTVSILDSGNPSQGNGTFLINVSGDNAGPQNQATVTVVNDNSAVTFVHFVSQSGDYIGQGEERTFSIATGYVITASRNSEGGASFSFDDNAAVGFEDSEYWTLDFGAATGGIFGLGDYENAERFGFQDSGDPGLDLSGDGRGSNMLTGNFQVLEASFDDNGNVLAFAANFVQHSEGATPALTGQVRYNSTVPLPVMAGTPSFSTAAYSVSEIAGGATITVNRTNGTAGALSVAYATSDGTAVAGVNYTATSGTLSWADGDGAPKTFTVPVRDDGVATADLSVNLQLTGPSLGAIPQATLTITNADKSNVGVVQFGSATFQAGSSSGAATITVNRAGGSSGPLSVTYATADGTAFAGVNYTPVTGTLTWASGDGTPKTFQVPLLDPVSGLTSQTVALSLSGTNLGAITKATLTINNANFPAAGTLTLSAATYAANETDSTATITVNRTGGSYGALSVNYATVDGTAAAGVDYVATQGTLTWADGDSSPKLFTIPILDPQFSGGTRSLLIQLAGADLGAVTQAVLAISENASVATTVSVATRTPVVAEEGGGTVVFLVTRTGGMTAPLTVAYKIKGAAKAGVDYKPVSGTVTIPAGAAKAKLKLKLIDHVSEDSVLVTKCLLLPSADGSYTVGSVKTAKVKILGHD